MKMILSTKICENPRWIRSNIQIALTVMIPLFKLDKSIDQSVNQKPSWMCQNSKGNALLLIGDT